VTTRGFGRKGRSRNSDGMGGDKGDSAARGKGCRAGEGQN